LDLNNQKLVGTISPHIGNLSFLRSLALEMNSFYGGIPSEAGLLYNGTANYREREIKFSILGKDINGFYSFKRFFFLKSSLLVIWNDL
jgi:hypothetical protein